MANLYSLFSESIKLSSDEGKRLREKEWIEEVLSVESDDDEKVIAMLDALGVSISEEELETEGWPSFSADVEDDELILYSEESFNFDHLLAFVQGFLRKFRPPKTYFVMQWADTCSRARPGEFGGGAAVILADDHRISSTYETVLRLKQELKVDEDAKSTERAEAVAAIESFIEYPFERHNPPAIDQARREAARAALNKLRDSRSS